MKKKVLIAYETMMMGGTTTALLSLLNTLDYDKYCVDLLLYTNKGKLLDAIPKQVNVLPQAYVNKKIRQSYAKLVLSVMNGSMFKSVYYIIRYRKFNLKDVRLLLYQASTKAQVSLSSKLTKHYDIAIGFMENWSDYYVTSNKIIADKRIVWIHPDYKTSYLTPEMDRKMLKRADAVVTVSESCRNSFNELFPEYKEKAYTIENLLSEKITRNSAEIFVPEINVDNSKINLITTCRIDNSSKALDRAVQAFYRLKEKGLADNINWFIIGDGADFEQLNQYINTNNLSDCVFMLGAKINPFPYYKLMDGFVLPSKTEGKPVSVSEALVMGLVCFVTNYNSAKDQITDGVDGFIFDNTNEGVEELFLKASEITKENFALMKKQIIEKDYSNSEEIEKIYRLFL